MLVPAVVAVLPPTEMEVLEGRRGGRRSRRIEERKGRMVGRTWRGREMQ
jgi:hypothetical protein